MPQFQCKLISPTGRVFETILEAESTIKLYELTQSRNENVISIKKYSEGIKWDRFTKAFNKVKAQELENFTSQLVVMLKAGVPLIDSLKTISEQIESKRLKEVVTDVMERVNSGASFSKSLARYPDVFNFLYINMTRVGETTGSLDKVLDHLREFIHHDIEVRRKVKSAMRYPTIVLGFLITAFTSAIVFVIPQFATLFGDAGVQLPLPTRMMLFASKALTDYGGFTLVFVVGLVFLFRFLKSRPNGAYQLDLLKLHLPVFKDLILFSSIARFAHIMETLNKSGIKIVRAMEITQQTIENRVIADDIANAREQVMEGVSLAKGLSESKHIPPMMIMMISAGEKSGALESMLSNVAEQYDTVVKSKIEGLSAAIEPLLTIVIGAFLLVFALAIFLPMWNIADVLIK